MHVKILKFNLLSLSKNHLIKLRKYCLYKEPLSEKANVNDNVCKAAYQVFIKANKSRELLRQVPIFIQVQISK